MTASFVTELDCPINTLVLHRECMRLRKQLNYPSQIGLQSTQGNDDWVSATGTKTSAHQYCVLNRSLVNTYLAELLEHFPDYYRWRILSLEPRQSYTVHRDSRGGANTRIHIPVETNADSWLQFWSAPPQSGVANTVTHHRLCVGKVYRVDTTNYHTAVNWGTTTRVHVVGEQDQ